MNTCETRSLREYLALGYRFKWRALACWVGTILLTAAWLWYAPREYQSEAKLFVRIGRENASFDPTVTSGETISLNSNREEEINSIVEHLRSRSLLEKLLEVYDPAGFRASPETRDKKLRQLERDVYIWSPRMSTVVTVQADAPSPQKAQQIVATLVKVYLDEHMRINRANGSYKFFLAQSELLNGQLEGAQEALRDAKDQAGMASIEGRRTALEGQISALETQIHQVNAQQAASAAKLKALEASVGSLPQPLVRQMLGGVPHDGLDTMEDQLFQLRIREKEALSKYTPEHPRAIAIHQQVTEVEDALRAQTPQREQIVSALTASESAELASLTVQKEKLQGQLDHLATQLVALNEAQVEIEQRQREVEQLETQYLLYTRKREEARMDEALKADRITNVSIIQSATFEPKPIRPQKSTSLLLGFVAGFVGAVVVVVASDQLGGTRQARRQDANNGAADDAFTLIRPAHVKSALMEGNGSPAQMESTHVKA